MVLVRNEICEIQISQVRNVQGSIFLTRWLQSALIPFVTTQSIRQNYTSVYSFDCNGVALSHHCYSDRMSVVLNSIEFF